MCEKLREAGFIGEFGFGFVYYFLFGAIESWWFMTSIFFVYLFRLLVKSRGFRSVCLFICLFVCFVCLFVCLFVCFVCFNSLVTFLIWIVCTKEIYIREFSVVYLFASRTFSSLFHTPQLLSNWPYFPPYQYIFFSTHPQTC